MAIEARTCFWKLLFTNSVAVAAGAAVEGPLSIGRKEAWHQGYSFPKHRNVSLIKLAGLAKWWFIPSMSLTDMVSVNSCISLGLLILFSAECIYKKKWILRPTSSTNKAIQSNGIADGGSQSKSLSAEDDAKLIFGTIFSLRNIVRKLGGPEDKYESPFIGYVCHRYLISGASEASYRTELVITSYTTMRLRPR